MNKIARMMILLPLFIGIEQAAVRKGVQTPLLQCWSDTSVQNLITVLNEYTGDVEIAAAPFGTGDRCTANRNELWNLSYIAKQVLARDKELKRSRQIHLVVHLGFHDKPAATADFQKNMKTVWTGLIGDAELKDAPDVYFHISAALEDAFADCNTADDATFVKVIQGAFGVKNDSGKLLITADDLTRLNARLSIRRSQDPSTKYKSSTSSLSVTLPQGRSYVKTVRREVHGSPEGSKESPRKTCKEARDSNCPDCFPAIQPSRYYAYSNDGPHVEYTGGTVTDKSTAFTITGESCKDCFGLAMKLKDQDSRTSKAFLDQKPKTVLLLWRPSYNLFSRKVISQDNSKKTAQLEYSKTTNRTDVNNDPHFEGYEQDVLRAFFGLK